MLEHTQIEADTLLSVVILTSVKVDHVTLTLDLDNPRTKLGQIHNREY